ncbi:LSMT-L [Symbiodinium necroappetens]|uniref:LSMT-L protein n=1 Tax=Symbiodinium necroappetens TaxID=1628268 RepID=A0A812RTN5_9DINO|nr:LSMT-L [Symbiodinium necroappetens]
MEELKVILKQVDIGGWAENAENGEIVTVAGTPRMTSMNYEKDTKSTRDAAHGVSFSQGVEKEARGPEKNRMGTNEEENNTDPQASADRVDVESGTPQDYHLNEQEEKVASTTTTPRKLARSTGHHEFDAFWDIMDWKEDHVTRDQEPRRGGPLKDGQDEEDTVALVPYIDLINHNPNSESRIRGVSEGANVPGITSTERYVVVRSDRYYNKYEQIYITYGRKSNAQLLMLYGFSMERNTQDSVTIAAGQLMETSPFADVKKRVLDEMEVPPEGVFPLYRDRFTNEMMMYLRMAIIQPEDLDLDDDADPKQVYRALKQLDIKQATGEVSERGALICLRGIIQELQDAYPTTLQEDEALIRDRQMFELLPRNQRNALRVRYGEKLIYRASLATIDRTLNNLPRLGQMEKERARRYQEMENSAFGRLSVKFESPFKARNLEELMKELDI